MQTEGIGREAPAAISVTFGVSERLALLDAARHIKSHRREWKGSGWKGGLASGKRVPGVGIIEQSVRPLFMGLGGEYATAIIINRRLPYPLLKVDCAIQPGGDGGIDFRPCGMTLQVKTRGRGPTSFVRRLTDRGRLTPLGYDALVFVEWDMGTTAYVLGWNWATQIQQRARFAPAKRGKHWNLEVDDNILLPIADLAIEIEGRM